MVRVWTMRRFGARHGVGCYRVRETSVISKLTYVNCDECGNPSEAIIGSAAEARETARFVDKFVRVQGRDLCPVCRGLAESGRSTDA
jgi:hypothetical protein